MGIGAEAREKAAKATRLLVDSQPIDPWLIKIDLDAKGSPSQLIELNLGLPILIFELEQCGETVGIDSILPFIVNDVKNHRKAALDGYLTIARYVIKPPPRRKSLGWFSRMFTAPPKWTPPAPQWVWSSIGEISLSADNCLVVKGICHQIV